MLSEVITQNFKESIVLVLFNMGSCAEQLIVKHTNPINAIILIKWN